MQTQTQNFEILIGGFVNFLKEKLGNLNSDNFYHYEIISEKQVSIPDLASHFKMDQVYAHKENVTSKIDKLIEGGFTTTDLMSILAPSKNEEAEQFLLGNITFRSSSKMLGQVGFLRKIVGTVTTKEFIICTYNIKHEEKDYKLLEITSDWENGIKLIALTIKDFERDQKKFIRERILKF